MARDSQRSKVYTAEEVWSVQYTDRRKLTLNQCQRLVDNVTSSQWWRNRSSFDHIPVVSGRGGTAWARWRNGNPVIVLPPSTRMAYVVYHELAHHLTDTVRSSSYSDHAVHGAEFAANMVALIRHFIGDDHGNALKTKYQQHKVKVRGAAKSRPVASIICAHCKKTVAPSRAWSFNMGGMKYCTKACAVEWFISRLSKA